jgi:hypothetical protein
VADQDGASATVSIAVIGSLLVRELALSAHSRSYGISIYQRGRLDPEPLLNLGKRNQRGCFPSVRSEARPEAKASSAGSGHRFWWPAS